MSKHLLIDIESMMTDGTLNKPLLNWLNQRIIALSVVRGDLKVHLLTEEKCLNKHLEKILNSLSRHLGAPVALTTVSFNVYLLKQRQLLVGGEVNKENILIMTHSSRLCKSAKNQGINVLPLMRVGELNHEQMDKFIALRNSKKIKIASGWTLLEKGNNQPSQKPTIEFLKRCNMSKIKALSPGVSPAHANKEKDLAIEALKILWAKKFPQIRHGLIYYKHFLEKVRSMLAVREACSDVDFQEKYQLGRQLEAIQKDIKKLSKQVKYTDQFNHNLGFKKITTQLSGEDILLLSRWVRPYLGPSNSKREGIAQAVAENIGGLYEVINLFKDRLKQQHANYQLIIEQQAMWTKLRKTYSRSKASIKIEERWCLGDEYFPERAIQTIEKYTKTTRKKVAVFIIVQNSAIKQQLEMFFKQMPKSLVKKARVVVIQRYAGKEPRPDSLVELKKFVALRQCEPVIVASTKVSRHSASLFGRVAADTENANTVSTKAAGHLAKSQRCGRTVPTDITNICSETSFIPQ